MQLTQSLKVGFALKELKNQCNDYLQLTQSLKVGFADNSIFKLLAALALQLTQSLKVGFAFLVAF